MLESPRSRYIHVRCQATMSEICEDKTKLPCNITDAHVRSALRVDKGNEAQLTSWTVADFTNKGDNYVCVVTSVDVNFKLQGNDHKTSYVVKISTKHDSKGFHDIMNHFNLAEVKFYDDLVPALNSELKKAGQPSLRVPHCFYSCSEGGHTLILMENLRCRGFRTHPRQKSLDVAHTSLVLQELARLHSASLLLQAKTPNIPLHQKYPHLAIQWSKVTQDALNFFTGLLGGAIDNAITALEQVGGYSAAINWLNYRKTVVDGLVDHDYEHPSPFTALCHGDIWTNNFLFRYGESGEPVEVMLVDFQLSRLSTIADDLSYHFFTSLDGSVRRQNTDAFLDTYHGTLAKVLMAGNLSVPFTLEQLNQEYQDKLIYGSIFSMMVVPVILTDGNDSVNFQEASDEKMEEFLNMQKETLTKKLIHSSDLKGRFIETFDELMERGVIPS